MAKVQVVFYSMYGHIYQMAEAVAAGAREVEGTQVSIFRARDSAASAFVRSQL